MKKNGLWISTIYIVLSVLLFGCTKEQIVNEDNHISNYTISYLENEDTKNKAEVLKERIYSECNIEMNIVADKLHTDENLIYIGGEGLANQTGTNLAAIGEEGYFINKNESRIYIYALTDKGYVRAYNALISNVGQDGCLNLDANRKLNMGAEYPKQVFIGDTDICEYVIVLPKKTSDRKEQAAQKLQYYISEVAGAYLPIVSYKDGKDYFTVNWGNSTTMTSDYVWKMRDSIMECIRVKCGMF